MTEKQKIFADEYLANPDLNATRAYQVAYPSVKKEQTAAASLTWEIHGIALKATQEKPAT